MRRYMLLGTLTAVVFAVSTTATASGDCARPAIESLHQIHDLARAYQHQQAVSINSTGNPYDDRAGLKLIAQKARQATDAYTACHA